MLTNEQVDLLFDFCERHHVHHYDVQLELVDHLANAIEEKMNADDRLTFEAALTSVHASFGVLGFAPVVYSRAGALYKHYAKLERKIFFSYFTWPKAAMTVCLFLLLMLPLRFCTGDQLAMFTQTFLISLLILQIYFSKKSRKRVKKQKKHLLLTQVVYHESWFTAFLVIQYFSLNRYDVYNSTNHVKVVIVYSVMMLISLLFFVSLLGYREMTNQTHELAKKLYPEAFEFAD
ncbi:MAG: hypothetical protein JWQ30_2036 [Sediminibacterium sp.]|nr:hypothetical protein [Sediminibacterium sp.]